MPVTQDRCPECGHPLYESRFDTTFRFTDGSERICLDLAGGLCQACTQLYVDPGVVDLLDLRRGRCVFAIESDTVLVRRASPLAD